MQSYHRILSHLVLFTIPLLLTCQTGFEKNTQTTDLRTHTHLVKSSYVKDTYRIDVHLPASYETEAEAYPLLVVLDGDKSSGMARDIVDWLSWSKQIPELIVVSIAYDGSVQNWWQKRSRDFTMTKDQSKIWGEWPLAGGGEAFTDFLRNELFPLIESAYRVSTDRTLAGVSLGGLFANTLFFTAPDLFNRYIIIGPALAWDNERIWEYEERYWQQQSRLEVRLYTAVGTLDQPVIIEPWKRFNQLINNRKYAGLELYTEQLVGETHISSWPVGLTRGLRTIFQPPAK